MRARHRTATVTATGILVLIASPLSAQPPGGPPSGPRLPTPFSPYLNLARGGVNPAINYYGLVRPQTQFSNAIQELQRQQISGPFDAPDGAGEQPVVTGQGFGFQNHLGYFQNQNSAAPYGNVRSGGFPGTTGRQTPGGTPLGVAPPRRR